MYSLEKIKLNISKGINKAMNKDLVQASDLIFPPNSEMGDLSLACFSLAKKVGKNPAELASFLVGKLKDGLSKEISSLKVAGPYLNFILNKNYLAENVIKEIIKDGEKYGKNKGGKGAKIIVEFAHPNTHKAFHIGHLRNIITGESVARILNNCGYKTIRANYQGDIGLHVAKCIWGVKNLAKEFKEASKLELNKKAGFLGKAYALGSDNYEKNNKAKMEIVILNKAIYNKEKFIMSVYEKTRKWSLDYFNKIYKMVDVNFDRLYFESEVFKNGKEIVLKNLNNKIFEKSDGAIIFRGENYGLHNRVFINSEGNPTYEAKDLGLARLQLKEYNPKKIIHVVGPEQAEYFKVVFKAMEFIMPNAKGKETHLSYGWVKLKKGKMSSRLGNVVLGEWLLDEIKKEIFKLVKENKNIKNKEETAEKISLAAVKYSILKCGLKNEIVFDIKESISLSGNSGPYLLYTYARINSIVKKARKPAYRTGRQKNNKANADFSSLTKKQEHELIFKLAKYPETVKRAGENYDPSDLAKYLFELAQEFNNYYHSVPILKTEEKTMAARLVLINSISQIIKNGLDLLGIETVEEM
jgi:arginyl-tRNA synthetase